MEHKIDVWDGCYPSSWNGKIVKEAMSHPAKYSSRLIAKIYTHILEEKWAQAGDSVVDPFGGVGLGAVDAMRLGLHWHGCELEPKFHKIGNDNIDLWNKKFGALPRWGTAHLHCGDSRRLLEVLIGKMEVSVSSPPFGISTEGTPLDPNKYPTMRGVLKTNAGVLQTYGETEGQLGAMKSEGFEIAISSPPFLQSEGGSPEPKPGGVIDYAMYARHAAGNASADGYGTTDGQLSSMADGSFELAVSSPPYVSGGHHADQTGAYNTNGRGQGKTKDTAGYGETGGQLGKMEGNDSGDDFWLASRAIVEQVYLALVPGGHAVWVVKDYIKNKKRVQFCDQWRMLCEAVGFTALHEHHASLIRNVKKQYNLENELIVTQSESKSFFRRLYEKRPDAHRIDWEAVLCMEKPL